ncbi:MAG: hypothetical protein Q8Q58_07540, partial [Candidatus Rokubacteria bacterium]|nr:hypothetical protein [Candidatus Rokubacteria bacterium]
MTSKDLLVALEGMGQKGKRAMTPLDTATANELRVKLGRGRELPVEAKPKRAAKPKTAPEGGEGVAVAEPAKKRAAGQREAKPAARKPAARALKVEPAAEVVKPAATIFRPAPAVPIPPPAGEVIPAAGAAPAAPAAPAEPTRFEPPKVEPLKTAVARPAPGDPMRPAAAAPPMVP